VHVVLYQDPQPPLVLVNRLDEPLLFRLRGAPFYSVLDKGEEAAHDWAVAGWMPVEEVEQQLAKNMRLGHSVQAQTQPLLPRQSSPVVQTGNAGEGHCTNEEGAAGQADEESDKFSDEHTDNERAGPRELELLGLNGTVVSSSIQHIFQEEGGGQEGGSGAKRKLPPMLSIRTPSTRWNTSNKGSGSSIWHAQGAHHTVLQHDTRTRSQSRCRSDSEQSRASGSSINSAREIHVVPALPIHPPVPPQAPHVLKVRVDVSIVGGTSVVVFSKEQEDAAQTAQLDDQTSTAARSALARLSPLSPAAAASRPSLHASSDFDLSVSSVSLSIFEDEAVCTPLKLRRCYGRTIRHWQRDRQDGGTGTDVDGPGAGALGALAGWAANATGWAFGQSDAVEQTTGPGNGGDAGIHAPESASSDDVLITSGVRAAKRRATRIFGWREEGLMRQQALFEQDDNMVSVVSDGDSSSDVEDGTNGDDADEEDDTESDEESDGGNANESRLGMLVELLQLQLSGLQLKFQKKPGQDRADIGEGVVDGEAIKTDDANLMGGVIFSTHASIESAQLEHYLRGHCGDDSMSVLLSFPKQGTKATPGSPRSGGNSDTNDSIGNNGGQKMAKCLKLTCVWVKPPVALQMSASPKTWSAQQQLGVPVDICSGRIVTSHRRAQLLRAGYLHKLSVDIEPAEVQLEDHTAIVLGKNLLPALKRLKVQQQSHKQGAYKRKCGVSYRLAELQQSVTHQQPAVSAMYDMMHMVLVDDAGRGGLSEAAYRALQNTVSPRLYLERIDLGSMSLFVTMRMAKRVSRKQSNNNESLYVSSDRTPVRLSAVTSRQCMLGSKAALVKELAANYAADALLSSPALLGSLDLLGNPTGLLREYAIGMKDLVLLPIQAVREGRGVGGLLRGVRDGSSSLVRHVVGGTLTSVAGFSASVARNLDANRLELNASRQRFAELKGTRRGSEGGAGLDGGGGTVGSGRTSFGVGLGLGILSAVTGPLQGAAQLVSKTSQGIMSTAGLSQRPPPLRQQRRTVHLDRQYDAMMHCALKLFHALPHLHSRLQGGRVQIHALVPGVLLLPDGHQQPTQGHEDAAKDAGADSPAKEIKTVVIVGAQSGLVLLHLAKRQVRLLVHGVPDYTTSPLNQIMLVCADMPEHHQ
jgi:hypothetical protein